MGLGGGRVKGGFLGTPPRISALLQFPRFREGKTGRPVKKSKKFKSSIITAGEKIYPELRLKVRRKRKQKL